MRYRHGSFKCRFGFSRTGLWRAIFVPVVPSSCIHVRLTVHGGNVGIGWILFMKLTHRVQIGKIALPIVRYRILVVEHKQRVDHVTLFFRSIVSQLQRHPDRLEPGSLRVVRQAHVPTVRIRTNGMCQSPIRHGVLRI